MTRTAEREAFLEDIITGAVEGGTGYWAQVSQYQYVMDGELVVYTGRGVAGKGTQAVLHELLEDDSGYNTEGLTLTVDNVASAIAQIERGEVKLSDFHRSRILAASRANDAGSIDADDADVIAQVALLGEIRYG